MLKYIPYVLMFMVATMIVYAWGLKRSQTQQRDLMNMLYSKCDRKVRKALQRNDRLSRAEIENLLSGTRVGLAFSRQKMGVTNPQLFAKSLLDFMEKQGTIKEEKEGGKTYYRLTGTKKH